MSMGVVANFSRLALISPMILAMEVQDLPIQDLPTAGYPQVRFPKKDLRTTDAFLVYFI